MSDTPEQDQLDAALFLTLYTAFHTRQQAEPDPNRAALLRKLAPLRNLLAHGLREQPRHADIVTALNELRERFEDIDTGSLGALESRLIRANTSAADLAKVLRRSDQGSAETSPDAVGASQDRPTDARAQRARKRTRKRDIRRRNAGRRPRGTENELMVNGSVTGPVIMARTVGAINTSTGKPDTSLESAIEHMRSVLAKYDQAVPQMTIADAALTQIVHQLKNPRPESRDIVRALWNDIACELATLSDGFAELNALKPHLRAVDQMIREI